MMLYRVKLAAHNFRHHLDVHADNKAEAVEFAKSNATSTYSVTGWQLVEVMEKQNGQWVVIR